jgi:outer membrane PBP1 activator LpoA protein
LSIQAVASIRLAGLAEDRGDPAADAEAYEAAAGVETYPLRGEAQTEAARCWVEAGETDRALAVFQRFETEFPDELAAPQIAFLIAELRLARQP